MTRISTIISLVVIISAVAAPAAPTYTTVVDHATVEFNNETGAFSIMASRTGTTVRQLTTDNGVVTEAVVSVFGRVPYVVSFEIHSIPELKWNTIKIITGDGVRITAYWYAEEELCILYVSVPSVK
jgi:hypothetical protein